MAATRAAQAVNRTAWRLRRAVHRKLPGAYSPPVVGEPAADPGADDPLTEIALRVGTDKATLHRYTAHYCRHFAPWREREFTLLEIGVGGYGEEGTGGASLRMWKEFFPRAVVVGLDIEDKSFVEEDRIVTYRGSQTDPAVLDRVARENGPIQIVIDDGSHVPAHIRTTFMHLFPLMPSGGIYAIEDLQTSYWPSWGGRSRRRARGTSMDLVKDLLDGLNHTEFTNLRYRPSYTDRHVVGVHAYHNLVFVEKGVNDEPSNAGFEDR